MKAHINRNGILPVSLDACWLKKTRAAPDPGLYTLSHPYEPVISLNQHLIRENQLSFGNQGGLDLCNEYIETIN